MGGALSVQAQQHGQNQAPPDHRLLHQPAEIWLDLRPLMGWTRSDLQDAIGAFKTRGSPVVDFMAFWELLSFREREEADLAFEQFSPKDGRLDFLHVLGPMVVMSDQHYISRASMLFSMHDISGAGYLNRAEFFIAAYSLFRGLACFIRGRHMPDAAAIEKITAEVFDKIDADQDNLVTLGEFLTFAYRSQAWRSMTAELFPSQELQIHEDQVSFMLRVVELDVFEAMAKKTLKQLERKLGNKIRLTPDVPEESSRRCPHRARGLVRKRPWRQPVHLTRGHAWSLWRFFKHVANGARSVCVEDLTRIVGDDLRASAVLEAALPSQEESRYRPENVTRILQHFCLQLSGGHVRGRLEALAEAGCEEISLRALCCAVWPHLRETEIETLVCWCKAYQAQQVLHEAVAGLRDEEPEIEAEDIEALFDVLAGNVDSDIGPLLEGLPGAGHLDLVAARRLVARLDASQPGASLSKAEVKTVIFHFDRAFQEQFKDVAAKERLQQQA